MTLSPPRGRILLRWLGRIFLLLAALPLGWFMAALALGLVPANVDWNPPERGITVFVRTNGVHTWIVMPKVTDVVDWRFYVPGEHLGDPRWGNGDHVAFGYGNRTFYLETPTWGDLTLPNALRAAFGGGPALLHVEHDHQPRPDEWQRPIRLTTSQYRRLVDFVRSRFRLDPESRTLPLLGRGYGDRDMFYEAKGGYSFVLTCNEWTGRALRHAGVRTGLWTPLSESIMWRLEPAPAEAGRDNLGQVSLDGT